MAAEGCEMSDKPNDIPQWALDEAERALVDAYVDHHKDFNPMSNSISVGLWDKFTETFARAVFQSRSQAFEELESALKAKKYLPSQGIDAEMEAFNDGLDEAIEAIRQHSQKGEGNE